MAVLSIPVQLTDINDHHPVFAKSTLTVELASSTAHQPLWQAQATDRDGPLPITASPIRWAPVPTVTISGSTAKQVWFMQERIWPAVAAGS